VELTDWGADIINNNLQWDDFDDVTNLLFSSVAVFKSKHNFFAYLALRRFSLFKIVFLSMWGR